MALHLKFIVTCLKRIPWTRENHYLERSYKILIKDGYLISADKILTKDGCVVRSYKMNGYLVRFLQVCSG